MIPKSCVRRLARLSAAVGVLACLMLPPFAAAQCGSKIVLDGGHLKGRVRTVATTETNEKGEVVARTDEEFDEHSRLVSRKLQNGEGSRISSTSYIYGRFGLLQATTESSDPKLRWTFKRSYSNDGIIVESFAVNADGELSVVYLRDSMDETPHSISRTFCFGPDHPKELNQRTLLLDYPRTGSETRVIADGVVVAKWWINRNKRRTVLRDDVGYLDLSFSKREFNPDGTSFEHAFVSASRRQQFIWRDADGRIVKSEVADVDQPIQTTEIQYNENAQPVFRTEQTGNSLAVRSDYSYRNDDRGNWVELAEMQGNVRKTLITRAISYFEEQ